MIDVPITLVALALLGRGKKSPGTKTKTPPSVEIDEIASINAWPRSVAKGGEVPVENTGDLSVIEWRRATFRAAVSFLSTDDRSVNALTNLVADGIVEHGDFNINDIALSVLTHWDIETASGQHEYNYNVGGIHALQGQQYFMSTDAGKKTTFCAYDSLTQGIADYFGFLSYKQYQSGLVALLMLPGDSNWIAEIGWAGYYGMDPVEMEQIYVARRAMVAVDVK